MKIIYALSITLLFSLQVIGQDLKPYAEMSYEELQKIDSKSLSKADKKIYKKAMRAAKKLKKKTHQRRG